MYFVECDSSILVWRNQDHFTYTKYIDRFECGYRWTDLLAKLLILHPNGLFQCYRDNKVSYDRYFSILYSRCDRAVAFPILNFLETKLDIVATSCKRPWKECVFCVSTLDVCLRGDCSESLHLEDVVRNSSITLSVCFAWTEHPCAVWFS